MSRKNGGIIGPANTPVGGLITGLAGGVWRMNDVANFVGNSQWPLAPQNIDNSLRFDDGSTDYLSQTQGSGNRRTFTISAWVKRSAGFGNMNLIMSNVFPGIIVRFVSADESFQIYDDGGSSFQLRTNGVFRDVSAWYHLLIAVDTTDGTSGDRIKMYINGTRETSFQTENYPSQNYDTGFNNGLELNIGREAGQSNYFDGYMSEVVVIDGQALDPTSFGEFDTTTGIWKPKKIGQIANAGTNSFYLDFKDSSNVGKDASGLNNDFTVNNLTSIDQSTDTCVENYATLNPLYHYSGVTTFSNGNTSASTTSSGKGRAMASIRPSSGKWYAECKIIDVTRVNIGVMNENETNNTQGGNDANSAVLDYVGGIYFNSTHSTNYVTAPTNNDIVQIALDLDNNLFWFGINGTWSNSATQTEIENGTATNSVTTFISSQVPVNVGSIGIFSEDASDSGASSVQWNFGNPPFSISSGNSDANGFGNFEYAVPSGYYALNTSNLNTYG
jgi:hypothetical protein